LGLKAASFFILPESYFNCRIGRLSCPPGSPVPQARAIL
jgi:hypothetical protein